jgi:hypothetical protein
MLDINFIAQTLPPLWPNPAKHEAPPCLKNTVCSRRLHHDYHAAACVACIPVAGPVLITAGVLALFLELAPSHDPEAVWEWSDECWVAGEA